MSLVSCPRVKTLVSKLRTPGFAKYWPNGAPRWKSVLPLPSTHPSSPPFLKGRSQKLLPLHLSCKTFLSLCCPVVIIKELWSGCPCCLLTLGLESNASGGMWCLYWGICLKGNRAGELCSWDCLCIPLPCYLICRCHGCFSSLSLLSHLFSWRKTAYLFLNAGHQSYFSCTLIHSLDHLFKYLLGVWLLARLCEMKWKIQALPSRSS